MSLGSTGKEVGQFYLPAGVWSDLQGRIYVADMFNPDYPLGGALRLREY